MATELHVLNDRAWTAAPPARTRSGRCAATAERLYAQLVARRQQRRSCRRPGGRGASLRYLRWAWLIEGAAQYFSGQIPLFRAGGDPPHARGQAARLPALGARRDHPRRHGLRPARARGRPPDAADMLVSRLRKDGAQGNLELAFDEPIAEIERLWRRHLREEVARAGSTSPSRLAASRERSAGRLVEKPDDDQGGRPRRRRRRAKRRDRRARPGRPLGRRLAGELRPRRSSWRAGS